MRIQAIDAFRGRNVYIVGTGPSTRLMIPQQLLDGEVVIALNQAWRYFPNFRGELLAITVHPELVIEREKAPATSVRTPKWIVKKKPPLDHLDFDDPRYYVFNTSPEWSTFTERPKDTLFIGRGVQQTAMDLAARSGARAVILVGVDMAALGGDHHGHLQHVQFHGLPPKDVYREYREWTARAQRIIQANFQIPVLSLSPFLGSHGHEDDYKRMCSDYGLAPLPPPEDVSKYDRKHTDPA